MTGFYVPGVVVLLSVLTVVVGYAVYSRRRRRRRKVYGLEVYNAGGEVIFDPQNLAVRFVTTYNLPARSQTTLANMTTVIPVPPDMVGIPVDRWVVFPSVGMVSSISYSTAGIVVTRSYLRFVTQGYYSGLAATILIGYTL